jgi:hypothetical protein
LPNLEPALNIGLAGPVKGDGRIRCLRINLIGFEEAYDSFPAEVLNQMGEVLKRRGKVRLEKESNRLNPYLKFIFCNDIYEYQAYFKNSLRSTSD